MVIEVGHILCPKTNEQLNEKREGRENLKKEIDFKSTLKLPLWYHWYHRKDLDERNTTTLK